jgi:hypothetical protein
MTAPLHDAAEANTLPALRGQARIELKAFDESYFWKGAAAVALEQIYRTSQDKRPAASGYAAV